MYSESDIKAFIQSVLNPNSEENKEIDKSILKQLIVEKVPFRHEVIRLIAELCKKESHRKECVSLGFLSLMKETFESKEILEKIASCRAVGNMCYENEEACDLVVEHIGVSTLFDVCRFSCQTTGTDGEQLRVMTLGALHNIINSNEKVVEQFLKENIFELFLLYVPFLSESKLVLFLFSICSNLTEHDKNNEQLISSGLIVKISNGIDHAMIYEHRNVIFPYLLEIAEEDRIKEDLCSSSIFFKLLTLCDQYADKDVEFTRECCYLVVVLVTTDAAVEHLLKSKEFDLLECGIAWLERSSLQLKMTGALIITNLTRNDASAQNILADKRQPDIKLVEQLKYFSQLLHNQLEQMTDEQAKVVHGVLGALRNLAVPTTNRSFLAKTETLQQVIPYIFVKNFSGEIAYKATGVIRFLVREATETAKSKLLDDKILQQIVDNAEHFHQGLQFESRRVLFLLPLAFKSVSLVEALARNKAMPLITSTLVSCETVTNRGIIQNEALIALNIIVTLGNPFVFERLQEAQFHETMKKFLKQDIEHPEMINNIVQLIHLMRKQKFLNVEQWNEYTPILEHIRTTQNPVGQRLIEQILEMIKIDQD